MLDLVPSGRSGGWQAVLVRGMGFQCSLAKNRAQSFGIFARMELSEVPFLLKLG